MRPLGELLHQAGWIVEGLLLPGFGPAIPEIGNYRWEDWVAFVTAATDRYRNQGHAVMLVGNSTGAALAIAAAAHTPVAGLALIAPFWRSHNRVIDVALPLVRPFLHRLRPFAKVDFENEEIAKSLHNVLGPETDLKDPATQAEIRNLPLPVAALAQVQRAGRYAYKLAPHVRVPVLVLQGTNDPVVHPRETRTLVRRLPVVAGYLELDADHELIRSLGVDGLHIAAPLLRFSEQLLTRSLDESKRTLDLSHA